jgi:hypothetical protein
MSFAVIAGSVGRGGQVRGPSSGQTVPGILPEGSGAFVVAGAGAGVAPDGVGGGAVRTVAAPPAQAVMRMARTTVLRLTAKSS